MNINFINGYASNEARAEGGGAIYWMGNNGKLINCTFTNNKAHTTFGFIDLGDVLTTSIIDPSSVSYSGGSICWFGDNGSVFNCEFKGGTANYGGAIYWWANNGYVDSTNFIKNQASQGNSIYYRGNNLTVNNSFDYYNISKNIIAYNTSSLHILNTKTIWEPVIIIHKVFKTNSSVNFSDEIIFEYGDVGSVVVEIDGASIDLSNISVVGHPEAIITYNDNVISVSNLTTGVYTLEVITAPDENHTSVLQTVNITVNKTNPDLSVNIEPVYEGNDLLINIYANKLFSGNVTVNINNNTNYTAMVVDGVGNISLSNYSAGNYNITIFLINDDNFRYSEIKSNAIVKVIPMSSSLSIGVNSITFGDVAVVNIRGNDLFSGNLLVNIASRSYTVGVVNGRGVLSVSGLNVGSYVAVVIFDGDDLFNPSSDSVAFNVFKKVDVISLSLNKVTVKKSAKKLTLQARLKINDNFVKGKKLTFKFNGKTYSAKTNSKGVAKVVVKKAVLKKLKSGKKITYTVSYDNKITKCSVKVK